MVERPTKYQEDQDTMVTASSVPNKRRVVRRRYPSSSSIHHKILRILSVLCALSISYLGLSRGITSFSSPVRRQGNLRGRKVWVHSDSQLFNERLVATQATHLIIVAGHSVLISGQVENAAFDESVWYLLDYQRGKGLPNAIVSHIQAGIKLALEDEKSLLVFSGGETRAQTGPDTEGASYFRVADALDLWDGRDVFSESDSVTNSIQSTVRARTITEEYATDSFENLMFSICRFHDITGSYPEKISLVSFTFKQQRFETLHAGALQWPMSRFNYVGVDPPSSTGFDLQQASDGERQNSLVPFQTDPYGCHTEVLQKKRRERNPFARKAPYELTCTDMKSLLHWCGPSLIPKNKVPWTSN